jgi:hypothetical protein
MAYQLLLPRNFKIHNVFHISKLQRHVPDTFDQPKPRRVTLNVRGGDWEPENILMDRLNNGRLEYFIKWKHQPEGRNTWEPAVRLEEQTP